VIRTLFKYKNLHNIILNQKKVLKYLLKYYNISNYDAFCTFFDVLSYEDLIKKDFYSNLSKTKKIAYVRTSGTNSYSKLIPISKEYLFQNHYNASKVIFFDLLYNYKQFHLLKGRNLILNGYRYDELIDNKPVIDISALLFENRSKWFNNIGYPKKTYKNWDTKLNDLIKDISYLSKITSISGVPTWMFSLFIKLEKIYKKKISLILPNLKLIIHGGVLFDNYYNEFNEIFDDRNLTFYNVYNATEGFYGIQYKNSLLTLLSNVGIFFEFYNNNNVYPIWKVKENTIYEIVITNIDGLIRYKTNDLIIFTNIKNNYSFKIVGRTSEYINAFGEDLVLSQALKALNKINKLYNLNIIDFFVIPSYSNIKQLGFHEWFFVVNEKINNIEKIEDELDNEICNLNNNYNQKRYNSIALKKLKIYQINFTEFTKLIKTYTNKSGGQTKLKKLYNNREIIKYLHYEK
jgi:hypothetical protein